MSVVGEGAPVVRNTLVKTYSIHDARAAMGIDWMTMAGLSQAIPPAYAEFIGKEALAHISVAESNR